MHEGAAVPSYVIRSGSYVPVKQPVARAIPQERAMRQIGQARLQVPLGIQAFDRQHIAVEQGDKGNRVLTLNGMRGGNIPFAVVLFDRQRMLRIRLLRLQRLQPLSAAANFPVPAQ